VLLFINDDVASVVPDARRLRDFEKVCIAAGESLTLEFEVRAEELAMAANDGKWYLEEGTFTIQCGNLTERIACVETAQLGYNIRYDK
jgi:beta-glucosidase